MAEKKVTLQILSSQSDSLSSPTGSNWSLFLKNPMQHIPARPQEPIRITQKPIRFPQKAIKNSANYFSRLDFLRPISFPWEPIRFLGSPSDYFGSPSDCLKGQSDSLSSPTNGFNTIRFLEDPNRFLASLRNHQNRSGGHQISSKEH